MSVTRVLVANRGEIAVRVIRACQSLGIETVAAVSDADRESLAAQMANRAVCIGPPRSADSYLKVENLIAAAHGTGCDALHPGYGFLSERAALGSGLRRQQNHLRRSQRRKYHDDGRQARSAKIARGAGVPLVPGSDQARNPREAAQLAETDRLSALAQSFRRRRRARHQIGLRTPPRSKIPSAPPLRKRAPRSATTRFIWSAMSATRAISRYRSSATGHGNVIHLGERDCSLATAASKDRRRSARLRGAAGSPRQDLQRRGNAGTQHRLPAAPAPSSSFMTTTRRSFIFSR